MSDPKPVEALATVIADHIKQYPVTSDWRTTAGHFGATEVTIAEAILAAGYVHLVTHLNSLTASERLELGDALCREAAEMDEEGE